TLTVLFNNQGYLSMKMGTQQLYPQGWAMKTDTFYGAPITPRPDYAALARAFAGYGETVADPGEIRPALQRALEAVRGGKAALVDVLLDRYNLAKKKDLLHSSTRRDPDRQTMAAAAPVRGAPTWACGSVRRTRTAPAPHPAPGSPAGCIPTRWGFGGLRSSRRHFPTLRAAEPRPWTGTARTSPLP